MEHERNVFLLGLCLNGRIVLIFFFPLKTTHLIVSRTHCSLSAVSDSQTLPLLLFATNILVLPPPALPACPPSWLSTCLPDNHEQLLLATAATMGKRKPSDTEGQQVRAKSTKKSKVTTSYGMCGSAISLSSAMLYIGTLNGQGWLAGGCLTLVGCCNESSPTKVSCHQDTQRRASRPRTRSPSSLLTTYHQLTHFVFTALSFSQPRLFFFLFPTPANATLPPTSNADAISTMPAPSAAQQKAYVSEMVQVTNADAKTAAKLLAKSNWNTSVAINAYVDTLPPGG